MDVSQCVCVSPVWSVGGYTCCWCRCVPATGSQGGDNVVWGCSDSLLYTKRTQTAGLPLDTNRSFHVGRHTCTDGLCKKKEDKKGGREDSNEREKEWRIWSKQPLYKWLQNCKCMQIYFRQKPKWLTNTLDWILCLSLSMSVSCCLQTTNILIVTFIDIFVSLSLLLSS